MYIPFFCDIICLYPALLPLCFRVKSRISDPAVMLGSGEIVYWLFMILMLVTWNLNMLFISI